MASAAPGGVMGGVMGGAMGGAYGSPAAPFETPGQSYGAVGGYGRPGSAAPPWAPEPSRFTRRWKVAIAGMLAVGVAAAVTVPLAFGSHESALSRAFTRSLLSPAYVSALAGETFTLDTSKDDSSNDSSSGCADTTDLTSSAKDRGDASRDFVAADHSTFISEEIEDNPESAQELNLLRNTLKSCSSTTIDGATVTLQMLPAPQIAGSSDTMAMGMSGQVNGNALGMEFSVARFGDTVVVVAAGGVDSSISLPSLTNSLLAEAVLQARPALPKS